MRQKQPTAEQVCGRSVAVKLPNNPASARVQAFEALVAMRGSRPGGGRREGHARLRGRSESHYTSDAAADRPRLRPAASSNDPHLHDRLAPDLVEERPPGFVVTGPELELAAHFLTER